MARDLQCVLISAALDPYESVHNQHCCCRVWLNPSRSLCFSFNLPLYMIKTSYTPNAVWYTAEAALRLHPIKQNTKPYSMINGFCRQGEQILGNRAINRDGRIFFSLLFQHLGISPEQFTSTSLLVFAQNSRTSCLEPKFPEDMH